MKKILFITVGTILTLLVFSIAGFAYAQSSHEDLESKSVIHSLQESKIPECPGDCISLNRNFIGDIWGHWIHPFILSWIYTGERVEESGLFQDYLWPALVEAFGLTSEQAEAFELVRETTQSLRKGYEQQEFQKTMKQAIAVAIDRALADGVITEKQAENWLSDLSYLDDSFKDHVRRGMFRKGFIRGMNLGRQMVLHQDYIDAALADVLKISLDDVIEMKSNQGLNLKNYMEEQGLNQDEISTLRWDVFSKAIQYALEDGAITQEQSDELLERFENLDNRGVWLKYP